MRGIWDSSIDRRADEIRKEASAVFLAGEAEDRRRRLNRDRARLRGDKEREVPETVLRAMATLREAMVDWMAVAGIDHLGGTALEPFHSRWIDDAKEHVQEVLMDAVVEIADGVDDYPDVTPADVEAEIQDARDDWRMREAGL